MVPFELPLILTKNSKFSNDLVFVVFFFFFFKFVSIYLSSLLHEEKGWEVLVALYGHENWVLATSSFEVPQ